MRFQHLGPVAFGHRCRAVSMSSMSFFEQFVVELIDVNIAGFSAGCEIGANVRVELDGKVERDVGLAELSARAAGEVDLGGDFVVVRSRLFCHCFVKRLPDSFFPRPRA